MELKDIRAALDKVGIKHAKNASRKKLEALHREHVGKLPGDEAPAQNAEEAEETPKAKKGDWIATCPLWEGGHSYDPGDVVDIDDKRGKALGKAVEKKT